MQQPRLAWAGPPPPSSHILMAGGNELGSYWGKAVANGDSLCDIILGTLRGAYV